MNRLIWAFALVALVALAALLLYIAHRPINHLLAGEKQSDGSLLHQEIAQYYVIKVSYPDTTPLYHWWNPNPDKGARFAIESWLKDDSARFITDIMPERISGPEKESLDASGRKYQYQALYQTFSAADGKTVSYEYDVSMDTGGAHPNSYFHTFTFDTGGNPLALSDLFEPGSDYLDTLASSSLPQVLSHMSAELGTSASENELFMDGLAPTEDNFSNWLVDGTDLVLLFPPYQVAPYAAGDFEVRIPLSQLTNLLKPEWR